MDFSVGDKVRMKIIGPVMTVVLIEKRGGKILFIECTWVSPKMKHYSERFRPEELVLVESASDENASTLESRPIPKIPLRTVDTAFNSP